MKTPTCKKCEREHYNFQPCPDPEDVVEEEVVLKEVPPGSLSAWGSAKNEVTFGPPMGRNFGPPTNK